MQFVKVQTYKTKTVHGRSEYSEVLDSLPLSEQVAIYRLSLIYIRGKRDRGVSVLLTQNMKDSLDILTNEANRQKAGVSVDNPYVFARSHYDAEGPHRSHDCLRAFAAECKAGSPLLITATNLPKQIATINESTPTPERK